MGYIDDFQETIDYIEENLTGRISIEECAKNSGFSKFHFHRLFGIHLGVTFMEYVRKRRLAYAMLDVIKGRRILDIALDYGYSSERTFSRAFQQEFGQLPGSCRSVKYVLPPKPVLKEQINLLRGGVQMDYLSEVRIEKIDTMDVVSGVRISNNPEEEVVNFVTEWAKKSGVNPGARKFGFDIPLAGEEQETGLRGYEYWVTVEEQVFPLTAGLTCKHIKGCNYAVLRVTEPYINPFERIPLGWKKLAGWVNSRGYKTSCDQERFWLEEELVMGGSVYMDLYFPIE
ncbi:helix-turn-helix domain-containing protein [Paenibacillus sp. PK3_47]|uniref:helix-turn-helix domain-containing protein n=1 Tax=Paenibacillus sp. PK3_47 TaxID=2072642 RepID=UPI00201E01C6|nr:helix-turn-helix domain-containing protein [Paenibacillus sp. PK3_47]